MEISSGIIIIFFNNVSILGYVMLFACVSPPVEFHQVQQSHARVIEVK